MDNLARQREYNLEERTAKFGEAIIDLCKTIPRNEITVSIIRQLIRSGTSIGSNYCEADCAESKKDFEHKLAIANKEAKETKHWLRMMLRAVPEKAATAQTLSQEARELNLIFTTIINNSRNNRLAAENQSLK